MITIREFEIELPEELMHRSDRIIQLVKNGCRDMKWHGGAPTELLLSDVVLKTDADDAWIADQIVSRFQQHAVKGR